MLFVESRATVLSVVLHVRNLVSHIKGIRQAGGVQEQGAEEDIKGPEEESVTGDWRKLHNDEFKIYVPHQISLT
jgi:hypothetical protein